MNAASADMPPAAGSGWKKFSLFVALAFVVQLTLVFLLGAKKNAAPRAVNNVPVFQLAGNGSELVWLTDPTLFVLPQPEDFAAAGWPPPPAVTNLLFRYTEAPSFLASPAVSSLGAAFKTFMRTNQVAPFQPGFKPEPQLFMPEMAIESLLPQISTWHLAGEIAGRQILNTFSAPTLAVNDVIAPSRVQLLVDTDGTVASAVLLESSGYDAADQQALELARTLRFAPADRLMFGEIDFNWHTVPVTTTNAP
jgi:TonB family protein